MERLLDCTILTPEKLIYEGEAGFAVVQAYNGEMGFLYDHSPLISMLGIGEVRLRNPKTTDYFVIEGGIVEIKNNKLVILAEKAFRQSELNAVELQNKISEYDETIAREKPDFRERFLIKVEQDKLKIRLKVAKK
jgi:F-type H+-transporting ATPase subunit epsilon